MEKLYAFDFFKGTTFHYEIIKDDDTYVTVKCLNCRGHEPCIVLLRKENEETYAYEKMLNNKEEYFWHSDKKYYLYKNKCEKDALETNLDKLRKNVDIAYKKLEEKYAELNKIKEQYEGLNVEENNKDIWIDDKLYSCNKDGKVFDYTVDKVIISKEGRSYILTSEFISFEVDKNLVDEYKCKYYLSKEEAIKGYLKNKIKVLQQSIEHLNEGIEAYNRKIKEIEDYLKSI